MREILRRLWTEPAYFVSAFVAVGELVLQIVHWPDSIEIPLAVFLVGLGGHVIRRNVTTTRRSSRA